MKVTAFNGAGLTASVTSDSVIFVADKSIIGRSFKMFTSLLLYANVSLRLRFQLCITFMMFLMSVVLLTFASFLSD